MDFNAKEVHKILGKYRQRQNVLLAVLQDIQEKYNWLPEPALRIVSEKLCIPLIDIYSVATFYRAFSLVPRGEHLCTVCLGTACHVRGAPTVLEKIEDKLGICAGSTTRDRKFTLETVNCLGACALAPIVVIDGKYHGQATVQKVDSILSGATARPAAAGLKKEKSKPTVRKTRPKTKAKKKIKPKPKTKNKGKKIKKAKKNK